MKFVKIVLSILRALKTKCTNDNKSGMTFLSTLVICTDIIYINQATNLQNCTMKIYCTRLICPGVRVRLYTCFLVLTLSNFISHFDYIFYCTLEIHKFNVLR